MESKTTPKKERVVSGIFDGKTFARLKNTVPSAEIFLYIFWFGFSSLFAISETSASRRDNHWESKGEKTSKNALCPFERYLYCVITWRFHKLLFYYNY